MDEYSKRRFGNIMKFLLLAVCIVVMIIGYKTVSISSLGLMLLGLLGILVLLYLYNRSQTKVATHESIKQEK